MIKGRFFDLHQPFGACGHGIESRKIPCDIGKRRLHLPYQLHDSRERSVCDTPRHYSVSAVKHSYEIHPLHGDAEPYVAYVGESVSPHAGSLVGIHHIRRA